MLGRHAAAAVVLASLSMPSAAMAGPCEVVPVPCLYEGLAFIVITVDAETRAPVAGVHVLAEWVMWGRGGRRDGPLMVQDALTDGDGRARFPGWGPIRGYAAGLVEGYDPILSFFKPGYEVALVENPHPPARDADDRVRRFHQDGETFALVPFRAAARSWIHQLRMAQPRSPRRSEESLRQFRIPYLNRVRRIYAEFLLLPEPEREDGLRQTLVEHDLRILEQHPR